MTDPRYSIGIDLGTSNSALAYIDSLADEPKSTVLPIAQLSSLDSVCEKESLPSCFYMLTENDRSRCPESYLCRVDSRSAVGVVGQFALTMTAGAPSRVIQSAKSWLCHDGVNRYDPLLPWGSETIDASKRLSPVETSAAYLQHLKDEWNKTIGAGGDASRFENQHITITVPASFDEVSQRLTLEAARLAGYPPTVRLLEEPQAAFYFWLERNADAVDWDAVFNEQGDASPTVLVCDIGGGTTDFSFFDLQFDDRAGTPKIVRTAVSDHLLLGGDNIDLAIAHLLEARLAGSTGALSASEWTQLVHQARIVKEQVLTSAGREDAPESYPVSIVGSSSRMFASARSAELGRSELIELLLNGFFPSCESSVQPAKRQTGLTEWGLPFVADSAVTHHLASFLNGAEVTAVLCTGGTLAAEFLQQRLLDVIASWQKEPPAQLKNEKMMLAVAHGAAYSGWLRNRPGQRISGGYAHSVYLEVERPGNDEGKQLVCILPKGTEEGDSIPLDDLRFTLRVDQMVRFQLWYSNRRDNDYAGQVVDLEESQFVKLPLMQTALRYSAKRGKVAGTELDAGLECSLNEIGVLQLHCCELSDDGAAQRWQLDFNLRSVSDDADAGEAESDAFDIGVPADRFREAERLIDGVFGKKKYAKPESSPKRLVRDLEQCLKLERGDWNSSLLRSLWTKLSSGMTARGRSLAHETAWFYLAGFCLRPGYGAELDLWRMTELWRVFHMGMSFPKEKSSQIQWWIMWRRAAGGLTAEQQLEHYGRVEKLLKKKGEVPAELVRLVGSLERLDLPLKRQLGSKWLPRAADSRDKYRDDYLWALGRIGARVPMYAEPNFVMSPSDVESWIEHFDSSVWQPPLNPYFTAFCTQVYRICSDRTLEVSPTVRDDIAGRLSNAGAADEQLRPLREYVPAEDSYRLGLFGESIPAGIKLVSTDF